MEGRRRSSSVGADVVGQSSAERLGNCQDEAQAGSGRALAKLSGALRRLPGRGAGGVAAGCSVGCCDACFGEVGRGLSQGRMGCRRGSDDAEKFGIFM